MTPKDCKEIVGTCRDIEIWCLPGVDRDRGHRGEFACTDNRQGTISTIPRQELSQCVSIIETVAFGPNKAKFSVTVTLSTVDSPFATRNPSSQNLPIDLQRKDTLGCTPASLDCSPHRKH